MVDTDLFTAFGVWASAGISGLARYSVWKPGEKLRILVVGYTGRQNIGADARTAAIVDQLLCILGGDRVQIGVLTLDVAKSAAYFGPPARLIEFSAIYFRDLVATCSRYHMLVLAEGSTLKSDFANAMTLGFCEAAGIMKRQGKPSIGYGIEAARMDPYVRSIASRLCRDTYFITRNSHSLDILTDLGLRGHQGTDTAWTFGPARGSWVDNELKESGGWDGVEPILGVAVINPFCWPCRPSLFRLGRAALTGNWQYHYEKWYFFSSSKERTAKYRCYIEAIARAVDAFSAKHGAHVVLFAMQAIDEGPCSDLRTAMRTRCQVVSSKRYDGHQVTGILQRMSLLITSRYHARVLSMAGAVPSVAVSFDERLRNLFEEIGHSDRYYLAADDADLREHLLDTLEDMWNRRCEVGQEVERCVPGYLKTMADMGRFCRTFIEASFPGVDLVPCPRTLRDFLPPLYPALKSILAKYGDPLSGT